MRIEIDGTVIAGRDNRESVRGWDVSGGEVLQRVMPLRAANPVWHSRGNESQAITFEVCRVHESIPVAALFSVEHQRKLSKTGTITISEEYDGKRIQKKYDGVIRQVGGCRIVGCSTFIRYELELGEEITT